MLGVAVIQSLLAGLGFAVVGLPGAGIWALLGRGVDVPMLVIFLGSIGGMLTMGIVGLFIGAVVLALGYKLLQGWMKLETPAPDVSADQ